jgi:dephospho-CoA kinase
MRPTRGKDSHKKIVLGITGSFGSGKTTVAGILKSFGAKVIDADKIAHSVIRPQTKIYRKIISVFGDGILKKSRIIDRNKLARVVFNRKKLLSRLNNIIHPEVIRAIGHRIRNAKTKVIVLDAPLLVEAGLKNIVDKLIVVKITKEKQLKRIQNRTSLSKSDILRRISSQIPLAYKVRLADFVIDNSGAIDKTKRQVISIWEKLQPRKRGTITT